MRMSTHKSCNDTTALREKIVTGVNKAALWKVQRSCEVVLEEG